MSESRYPLEPLAEAMHLSANQAIQVLGLRGKQGQEVRRRGFTELTADRAAAKAGLHPFEVWPEMRAHIVDELAKVCAAPGCEETFIPKTKRRIYCSTRCRDRGPKRRWAARKYRTDPVHRERVKARSAARYERERDYVLAQRRRSRGAAA